MVTGVCTGGNTGAVCIMWRAGGAGSWSAYLLWSEEEQVEVDRHRKEKREKKEMRVNFEKALPVLLG